MIRILVTLALALAGGGLFTLIHAPIPWLLGPMAAAFAGARLSKKFKPKWPGYMRNTAIIIVGYSLGLSFTRETLREMGHQLPTMILMSALLMLFSAFIGWLISRLSGVSYATALMGSIPGGLSQMLILAEETKGIDITIVTFLQVSRLMMIIFCVPLLIFSPLFGGIKTAIDEAAGSAAASWSGLFPGILLFAVVCLAVAVLAKRIRFPSPYLLGPMIITAVLHLAGVHGPALPTGILGAAQLLIGTYVGLLLHPEQLQNKVKTIGTALLSGLVLIAGALGLSWLLSQLHSVSHSTAFLSMAPGGMDQMGIIGKEIHADIALVSCYQLFRTWFIFFAVLPLMRFSFRRLKMTRDAESPVDVPAAAQS